MTDLEELYKHYLAITNDKVAAALLVLSYTNQNKSNPFIEYADEENE